MALCVESAKYLPGNTALEVKGFISRAADRCLLKFAKDETVRLRFRMATKAHGA